MAAVTTITLVKKFPYRGDPLEEFSNTYSFKGLPPGDAASWSVLVDDLVTIEKKVLLSSTTYTFAYGYNSDNEADHHVYSKDFAVPGPPPVGTLTSTGITMAGDQAACVEWKCLELSSKGKPIWLRKYLHHGTVDIANNDSIDPTYRTALGVYVPAVQNFHGGLTNRKANRTVTDAFIIPWVTTRTLKRRGKRPLPKP
jgi:hypothetical protein